MSKTLKDQPSFRKHKKSKGEELHQNYIREKHFKQDRYQRDLDACLDCGRRSNVCSQCSDDCVDDLVTIFERSCRA